MFAAQPQEGIDIDVIEFHRTDARLGFRSARRLHDRVVDLAALLGLEIIARDQRRALELAGMVVVKDKAQRLEFVAQYIDSFERAGIHRG